MAKETIIRHLVNNHWLTWHFLHRTKNYSICEIDSSATMKGCIVRNSGQNNRIIVESGAALRFGIISIRGNNNTLIIRKDAEVNGCVFFFDDDGNTIDIGEKCTFTGKSEFITTEGTRIDIGRDCMFAYGIVLRTGDHHSIFNDYGIRINQSLNIKLGEHVWIGQNAYILKGVELQSGSIVGASSVVTRAQHEENIILVGNPAKKIKSNIAWDRARV